MLQLLNPAESGAHGTQLPSLSTTAGESVCNSERSHMSQQRSHMLQLKPKTAE